ncbi:helix-turn-helix transcriptional regulator [Streptomyces atroolivaceus]|uniref:helix-turn-helix transcriptional regulator n=1 Tax=Streptomyces atroolivaceus TaxID=66869 RepID=UPI003667B610
MTRDWARLGELLRAARTERGMEQQDVAESIGVKRGALHNIEHGKIARVGTTVLAYARLVGWTDGSAEAVLRGGDPVLRDVEPSAPKAEAATEPAAPEPAPSDLSVLVQQALREGPLLDSRVAEVTTPGGRVRATIVIRGEDGTSPEGLLAALRSLKIDVSTDE